MKISLDVDRELVEKVLHEMRGLKDDFLYLTVEEISLAEIQENLIWYLKVFNSVDKLILSMVHKMDEEAKKVNECAAKKQDESHCTRCADKDKLIILQEKTIKAYREEISLLERSIEARANTRTTSE